MATRSIPSTTDASGRAASLLWTLACCMVLMHWSTRPGHSSGALHIVLLVTAWSLLAGQTMLTVVPRLMGRPRRPGAVPVSVAFVAAAVALTW